MEFGTSCQAWRLNLAALSVPAAGGSMIGSDTIDRQRVLRTQLQNDSRNQNWQYGRTDHSTSPDRFARRSDLSEIDLGANRTGCNPRPQARSSQRRVLVEQGDRTIPFFVVISGELEAVRPTSATETLISIFGAGQFTGEINTLSGRRAMARIRARQDGEVIHLDRESLLALVQTDAELSEILMRAFILRRVELLAQGIG